MPVIIPLGEDRGTVVPLSELRDLCGEYRLFNPPRKRCDLLTAGRVDDLKGGVVASNLGVSGKDYATRDGVLGQDLRIRFADLSERFGAPSRTPQCVGID